MGRVISKTYLGEILDTNGINAIGDIVNAGSWRFDKELDRINEPFPKNVENKIINFLNDNLVNYDDNRMWIEFEKRGRNISHSGAVRSTDKNFAINNINGEFVSKRLKEIGWKIGTVALWFSESPGKLNNMMHGHAHYVHKDDTRLLSYFCRCNESDLVLGGSNWVEIDFRDSATYKANYTLNNDSIAMLNEKELDKFIRTCGIPKMFFEEILSGKLRLTESLCNHILACYNKCTKADFEFSDLFISTKLIVNKKEEQPPASDTEEKSFLMKQFGNIPDSGERKRYFTPINIKISGTKPCIDIINQITKAFNDNKLSEEELEDIFKICLSLKDIAAVQKKYKDKDGE